ncbi:alpha/beta-hydrolase [Daedalea quercina L-15889]|uniref:Alpha/beta-hydrolase n=1 Tax=Daedalea quercina L-15889 TaxID=1314783 RepID=A0A165PK66_9APHY|nr:alpha/beta-hydrolase [Daedalea quercina L-15889]
MPLAPIDDQGTHYYYEDTGAPPGSADYTTLVLIHGALIHGASFRTLFPFAPQHNCRLVTLNMRDYPGSTPYTNAELAAMRGPDRDGQRTQLHKRGLEISAFIMWFIRKENIPPFKLVGEKASGGISILGWSWGNTMTLSFVARARELPKEDQEFLETYMRTLVIYELSPHSSLSSTSCFDETHNPMRDQTLTGEQQAAAFLLWVSGYYAHSPLLLDSLASLNREEAEVLLATERVTNPPPQQVPTVQRLTAEEKAATAANHVWARSQIFFQPEIIDMELYRENTRVALQDASIWPRFRVCLVWADMTIGEVLLTSWDIVRHAKMAWPERGRQIEVVRLEGGNHFFSGTSKGDVLSTSVVVNGPTTKNTISFRLRDAASSGCLLPPSSAPTVVLPTTSMGNMTQASCIFAVVKNLYVSPSQQGSLHNKLVMPFATVDEAGSQCYYVDTGAPPNSSSYTTLVLVHGAGFQGSVFERLFPYAAKYDMRLVAVNMRDYSGSTPYSPSEFEDLRSEDVERQAKALRARGLELIAFLRWYISKEDIPPLSQGSSIDGGGISMLGWSWGCKLALSCIARAHELELDDREFLARYMRSLILLDPSPRVFGAPLTTLEDFDFYNPFTDPDLPPEAKIDFFPQWVSEYYSHSPTILYALADQSHGEMYAGFARGSIANPPFHQTPTLLRMSPEERDRVVNKDVLARSHIFWEILDSKVYTTNTRKALYDASVWPKLRVSLLWCDMSLALIVMATWGLLKDYQDWPANGRSIHTVRMKGANHFPQWDQPERTMQLLANVIWTQASDDTPAVVDMQNAEDAITASRL